MSSRSTRSRKLRALDRRPSRGFVGVVRAELHFPANGSLKDKRTYLRSMRAKLTRSFGATFAEVGYQDLWQRADVVFAIAASGLSGLEAVLDEAETYLGSQDWELVSLAREVYEVDG